MKPLVLPKVLSRVLVLAFATTAGLNALAARSWRQDSDSAKNSAQQDNGGDGGVYKVGDGVLPPKTIYSPPPEYTEKARKLKEGGIVTVTLIVGVDGKPRDVRVKQSDVPDLDENVAKTVRTWRFNPATKDGKPVVVIIAVQVNMQLGK